MRKRHHQTQLTTCVRKTAEDANEEVSQRAGCDSVRKSGLETQLTDLFKFDLVLATEVGVDVNKLLKMTNRCPFTQLSHSSSTDTKRQLLKLSLSHTRCHGTTAKAHYTSISKGRRGWNQRD